MEATQTRHGVCAILSVMSTIPRSLVVVFRSISPPLRRNTLDEYPCLRINSIHFLSWWPRLGRCESDGSVLAKDPPVRISPCSSSTISQQTYQMIQPQLEKLAPASPSKQLRIRRSVVPVPRTSTRTRSCPNSNSAVGGKHKTSESTKEWRPRSIGSARS